jgi:hypothetical protein
LRIEFRSDMGRGSRICARAPSVVGDHLDVRSEDGLAAVKSDRV